MQNDHRVCQELRLEPAAGAVLEMAEPAKVRATCRKKDRNHPHGFVKAQLFGDGRLSCWSPLGPHRPCFAHWGASCQVALLCLLCHGTLGPPRGFPGFVQVQM